MIDQNLATFELDEPTLEADDNSLRTGVAALVWAVALTAFAVAPAVVIWAWRWFL